ncbi:MAG: tRNA pseudouridine(55) synthase TruB [Gammaproteobacteria bacterium]
MSSLQNVTGFLLLDKALESTSNRALQQVKHLYHAKKAGHTGSLDPLATGMLPICFGAATRFSQYLLDADKTYEFTAALGEQTATADREGEVIATAPLPEDWVAKLPAVLESFLGTTQQIPSMYAAIKHQGRPLYEYARAGVEIERTSRSITLHELTLLNADQHFFHARVRCSKGTYVRTLVEDIAKALGTVGHVHALHRTQVGPFLGDKMYTYDALKEMLEAQGMESLLSTVLPLSSALMHFPSIQLPSVAVHYITQGQAVTLPQAPESGFVRLLDQNARFLGIGEMVDGKVNPRTLI